MPLKVVSFATYLNMPGAQWRDDDFAANKFIKAVKGETIRGFARVPVRGARRRLETANLTDAVGWFGTMASDYMESEDLSRPLLLVPIPNSASSVRSNGVPRTVALAEAVAQRLDEVEVLDCLRWRRAMDSASRGGGTRNPQSLYGDLVLIEEVPQSEVILIDDVSTTGGHLRAARALILEQGAECDLAICAGRTVWDQDQEPFSLREEEFPNFTPR